MRTTLAACLVALLHISCGGSSGGGGGGGGSSGSSLNTSFLSLEAPGFLEENITAALEANVYEVDPSEYPVFDVVSGTLTVSVPARTYVFGDILIFGEPPNRTAVKIVSVSAFSFGAVPAEMEEVFTDGDLSFKTTPDFSLATSAGGVDGTGGRVGQGNIIDLDNLSLFDLRFDANGTIIPGQSTLMGESFSNNPGAITRLNSSQLQAGFLRAEIVEGSLSIIPTVTHTFTRSAGGQVRMDAHVLYSLRISFESSGKANFSYSMPLFQPLTLKIPTNVPGIFLLATLDLPLTFDVDSDFTADAEFHYESEYAYRYDIDYDLTGADFSAQRSFVSESKSVKMLLAGHLTATAYLQPTLAITVQGLIGPSIWLKPYVTVDLEVPWRPNQDELFVGIEGGCGLTVLRKTYRSKDLLNVPQLAWDLFGPSGGSGSNSAPNCNNSWATVSQGTSQLQLMATDPDGDPLHYTLSSLPSNGQLGQLNSTTGQVTYTPDWGYRGSDSFTFTAHDGLTTGNAATVYLDVLAASYPPQARVSWTAGATSTNTIALDASGSTDPEDPTSVLEVRWDFENDGIWNTGWSTTKTETAIYASPGGRVVRLEVKDTTGMTDIATATVWVSSSGGGGGGGGGTGGGSTVAHWSFDANANESLGFTSLNGTLVGGAVIDATTFAPLPGNLGSLRLGGEPQRVDLPGNWNSITGEIPVGTLEAWLRIPPQSPGGVVFNHGIDAVATDLQVEITVTTSTPPDVQAVIHSTKGGNPSIPLPGFGLSSWHHVAWTWDRTSVEVFLDGTSMGVAGFSGPEDFSGNEAEIGSDDQEIGWFVGHIDEVRISDTVLAPGDMLLR